MKFSAIFIFTITWTLNGVVAPPVTSSTTKSPNDINSADHEAQDDFNVEYDRYLKEVVQALESDPQFREKLQKAEDADIRSGKIAHELEYVSHAVRSRLDEVKRTEMERLRKYARKAYELQHGMDTEHLGIQSVPDPEHIDDGNPDTFEIEDLRRLIAKTTKDLAEADKKRREEFKEYEMQKEFEKHEKVKNMTEEEKKKFEAQEHDKEEKHKKHDPLHHPISKPQLEEVWEKSDHMENQEFDPKTFFYLHDLDGNGVWDFDEVKALFLKELDKMYQAGAPEDDMRERVEEMERMREHVFQEADVNRDGLISYEEFLAQTQKKDFNSDPGWETLDQQQAYTPEEYHKFEMQRQHEIEAMIADGRLPQYHGQNMQYGGHPQQQFQGHPQQQFQGHPQQGHAQQQFQGHPQQGHPQQFQAHPQQGQPQQFQAHPQQGQPQQFQAHPQQGQPQQFQAHPQQGQPQQFQAPAPTVPSPPTARTAPTVPSPPTARSSTTIPSSPSSSAVPRSTLSGSATSVPASRAATSQPAFTSRLC
ncbi:nucleobindin-2 [Frankliniella occidentalis]|uniref:Nucleobindin-2 n=1 Tax=Frankliniella occidentalis TaxID=133901 RepID=A0A6J1SMU1_FRAOC|nr:nucleobindin-2 [Frankliniella occidentalis]XP_026280651.2 nucleobindin-2 [Frankliniella occidentalis]